ncbi:hypothetical protein E0Z10_g5995 [Xylaria hypoxylon]|uniref:Uncharacterized protein n=1 Tax=Xylaria hypoxylon TaxID=37992 RepID=A0A4Z0YUH5_9PEZI|nr:hypothetical protein E0Z10_g5995 [Xylaria hypoxylon]
MNDTGIEKYHRYDDSSDPDTTNYKLRLWPPPRLQAYCLDHFLMECENYYEQENERYNKLVANSRQTFLEKQNKKNKKNKKSQLTSAPTRLQPSRRAKEKHTALGTTPPTTPDATTPQGPPKPKTPSNVPFKPAKLERAFKESQQGVMFRILDEFHKKLELQKSWENYRLPLEDKIQETVKRLLTAIEKGKITDTNCVFRGPLGIECRYCGFVDTVQDDETTTPRKLAPPAAMHDIKPLSLSGYTKESGLMFRGTNFIVDACSEKTMIVLMN